MRRSDAGGCGCRLLAFFTELTLTFGAAIKQAAARLPIPVLKPNEAIIEAALNAGNEIGMLATSAPAVGGMEQDRALACARGRGAATIHAVCVPDAMAALRGGDAGLYQRPFALTHLSLRGAQRRGNPGRPAPGLPPWIATSQERLAMTAERSMQRAVGISRVHVAGDAAPFRVGVITLLTLAVMAPVGLIAYQSLLDNAFFDTAAAFGLDAFDYVLTDPDFWQALRTTAVFSVGMGLVATPLGAGLAFLLVPMFISSIVLAFGYTVAVGPTGFLSLWVKDLVGFVPWSICGMGGLIVIGGLSHVPHVYLYLSSAMRSLPSDLEARRSRYTAARPRLTRSSSSAPTTCCAARCRTAGR